MTWPTRYKCPSCTRITDRYPFGCKDPNCPVKRDMIDDTIWTLTVGLPLTILAIVVILYIIAATGSN